MRDRMAGPESGLFFPIRPNKMLWRMKGGDKPDVSPWVRTGCPSREVACRLGSSIIKTASPKKGQRLGVVTQPSEGEICNACNRCL